MKNIKSCLRIACAAISFLMASLTAYSQNRVTVRGMVLDSDSLPVIGASVMVKGTSQGVPTDLDGNYVIEVSPDAVLEFSYIGYATVQEKVSGRTQINVILTEDNNYLESVVVVGYGTQKKGSVIGAVSGVGSDDILTTKSENPQNMLTGKIPGLRVWQKSAEPGTYSASFDIRGMGSPLVIIDGVPRSVQEFQRLNASDIDNVSVLKDASAAIYGVRAGNGVVLVTTKKGSEGKAKVNYSGSFTFQTPSKMPELTDVYDAMTLWNEKNLNAVIGGSVIFTEQDYEDYRSGKKMSSDWNRLIMARMSPQTQHDLSISGGTEKIQYYLSFGYLYQEGFFKSRDLWYDKYNLRSNITAEVIDGMKLNLNISGLIDQRHTPYSSSVDIIRNYWSQGVVNPAFADKEQTMLNYAGLDLQKNTVAMMTSDISGYHLYNQKYFQSSASLEYDFGTLTDVLKGLSAKALFGYDFKYNQDESFRKEYYLYAWDEKTQSYDSQVYNESTPNNLTRASYNQQQTLAQFIINYDRTFAEKHKVGALVGYEMQKHDADNYYASGDLAFGTPYFTSLSGENQLVGIDKGSFYEVMYQALIGRLNYSYADRYLLEAQFRYDGSSKFAPGHQWGFFPSVSAGWRISEEPFFKDSALSFINQLKIRASYGVLGDDNSMNYEWISGYTFRGGETAGDGKGWYQGYAPGYMFNGNFVYSVDPSSLPNQNITWLRSTTFNIGADFEAWRGKLGASFDYFQRIRRGIFSRNSVGLPTIVGASAPYENLDSDSHLGLELELYHKNKVGEFSYEVKTMMSVTRQKHLVASQNGGYGNSYDKWRHDNLNNRYQGVQFGYEAAGRYESWEDIWSYDIYKENNLLPGDYKYLDWNGDGEINGYDAHPIAFDQTPWMNYSLSFNLAWKGLDFSMLWQGSALGSMKYSEPLYNIWGSTGGGTLVQYLDRWHPTETGADIYDPETEWIPGYYGFTGHYPDENSSFNRVSTAFLRLKSVEVGYTIPKFKKAQNFSLRVYANAYNPVTITAVKFVDPEHPDSDLGRMYPLNKTYTIGLSLSF